MCIVAETIIGTVSAVIVMYELYKLCKMCFSHKHNRKRTRR